MGTTEAILITGANGEIGHGLIETLAQDKNVKIIAFDILKPDPTLKSSVDSFVLGNILNKKLLSNIMKENKITTIFHLAAILSTGAEKNPEKAHQVNVEGTLNLLAAARECLGKKVGNIKFIFPSSIAVYGLPDIKTKKKVGAVKEDEFTYPQTMYGVNKLYGEHLGYYFSRYYRRLDLDKKRPAGLLDFRTLRFPGIISATTLPTGGTSDYAPEMIHAAASGKSYRCFVKPETKIPFMIMPEAIRALIRFSQAPRRKLRRFVYNVSGFSVTAKEIATEIKKAYPAAKISYRVDKGRQAIVDSWPEGTDDSAAYHDWDWSPNYDFQKAFKEYLLPKVSERYLSVNS